MHKFGGRWTEAKLSALREYLLAYTSALKNRGFALHYFDAFAGSGSFVPTGEGRESELGLARIALDIAGFQQYLFIEKRERRCKALRELLEREYPQRSASVLAGDANELLTAICKGIDWRSNRAVLFLDPYGLQVEWSTLEQVASTKAIDVWYLFPLNGITRQLCRNEGRLDDVKRRALDRVLGTQKWREAFYAQQPTGDLFQEQAFERHADSRAILNFVSNRLHGLFPAMHKPVVLHRSRKGRPASGPPLFALYFLVGNPAHAATSLALRISEGVLGKLRRDGMIT